MIRFAIMLRSKLNRGTYQFVASIFNLPSARSFSNYDSINGSAKDGVLFGNLRTLGKRLRESMTKVGDDDEDKKESSGCV